MQTKCWVPKDILLELARKPHRMEYVWREYNRAVPGIIQWGKQGNVGTEEQIWVEFHQNDDTSFCLSVPMFWVDVEDAQLKNSLPFPMLKEWIALKRKIRALERDRIRIRDNNEEHDGSSQIHG